MGVPGEHLRIDVAQRLDARPGLGDRRDRRLAFRATHVVLRCLEPPRCIGVADDEHVLAGWQRYWADFERAAVQEERPPRPAECNRGLVHDPALHADVVVLAPLAEPCELHLADAVGREVRRIEQKAEASSSAADDDSPADTGRSLARTPRNPWSGSPADWSDQAVAAT